MGGKVGLVIIGVLLFWGFNSCQKKQNEAAIAWSKEVEHLCRKWKVDKAYMNSNGLEENNSEEVTYDWDKWTIELWNSNAYRIIEYSPDSAFCTIESGTWQLDQEYEMLFKGSESLIEFSSGNVISEEVKWRYWSNKKNENDEVWIWSAESIYPSTGVFLKLIPA